MLSKARNMENQAITDTILEAGIRINPIILKINLG